MNRREFIQNGAVAVVTLAAGCSGGGGEKERPEASRQRQPADTSPSTTLSGPNIADSALPEFGAPLQIAESQGLAAPLFGTAMGDRYFDAAEAGDEDEVRRRMQVAKSYGQLTRVDFNGYNPDWKMHDLIMGVAKEEGLGVVAMIGYIEMSLMPDYSKTIAERYGQHRGGPIVLAELGNEPNGTNDFGKWGEPNPEAYAAMAVDSARAIQGVTLDIPIITGGLSPGSDSEAPRGMAPVTHMKRMLKAMGQSGIGRFAGWGFHPYAWSAPDYYDPYSAWGQIQHGPNIHDSQDQTIVEVLDEFGAKKTLYLTEFGAPTGGNSGNPVTLEAQEAAARMFLYEIIPGVETPVRLWHTVFDNEDRSAEGFFGLVTVQGQEKPAGLLIRTTLRDAA